MKLYTEQELRDFIDRIGCIVESDLDEARDFNETYGGTE